MRSASPATRRSCFAGCQMSPLRDISSPVLFRLKKLSGRLSRCSNSAARKSQMRAQRHPCHQIGIQIGHDPAHQHHQRDQAHDQHPPRHRAGHVRGDPVASCGYKKSRMPARNPPGTLLASFCRSSGSSFGNSDADQTKPPFPAPAAGQTVQNPKKHPQDKPSFIGPVQFPQLEEKFHHAASPSMPLPRKVQSLRCWPEMGRSGRMASNTSAAEMAARHSARPPLGNRSAPLPGIGSPPPNIVLQTGRRQPLPQVADLRNRVKVETPSATARCSTPVSAPNVQPAALQQRRQLSDVQPRQTHQPRRPAPPRPAGPAAPPRGRWPPAVATNCTAGSLASIILASSAQFSSGHSFSGVLAALIDK